MKLYYICRPKSLASSACSWPRKGVEVPTEEVDIRSGVNRQPEFLSEEPIRPEPGA